LAAKESFISSDDRLWEGRVKFKIGNERCSPLKQVLALLILNT